jgi:hypothetical protein
MFKYILGLLILFSQVYAAPPVLRRVEGDVFPGISYNRNLLKNGDFQSKSVTYGWTISNGTASAETANYFFQGMQALKVVFSSVNGNLFSQSSPSSTYVFGLATMEQSIWLANDSASNVEVCSLKNGSEVSCQAVATDSLWHFYKFTQPGTALGDTFGIKVKTTSSVSGDIYAAKAYVGLENTILGTDFWGVSGNAGTTSSNFIGTTDSQDLIFKANNSEKMRIKTTGNIGVGTSVPAASLDVTGPVIFRNNLRLYGATTGYVGLQASGSSNNVTWSLPSADGTSGQVLTTNGLLGLFWSTISSSGGGGLTYRLESGSFTAVAGEFIKSTGASATGTLPTASGVTNQRVKLKYSGSGSLTVNTTGGELIDAWASGNIVLYSGESMGFISDGTNWLIEDRALKAGNSDIYTNVGGDITISSGGFLRYNATPAVIHKGVTITQDATAGIKITCDRYGYVTLVVNQDLTYSTGFALRLYKNGTPYRSAHSSATGSGFMITSATWKPKCSPTDYFQFWVGGTAPGGGLTNNSFVGATLDPEY